MEFNEKLQELRKQKKLTQEELADALFVSRTAISKWESGRGYPNIDSLKAIAKFFKVTIDQLLSGEELLTIAEQDTKQQEKHFQDLVFGILDIGSGALLFLPFFASKENGALQELSLLSLTGISTWLKTVYYIIVFGIIICGILTLALQSLRQDFWVQAKTKTSLILNTTGAILFIISLQPYAAVFILLFLIIKASMLIKWR